MHLPSTPAGSITNVAGIEVGHFTDSRRPTGCSVIVARAGAVAGVDVRGGAPGTRETELLHPSNLVECVHAVLLAGGSAWGLDAASGVISEASIMQECYHDKQVQRACDIMDNNSTAIRGDPENPVCARLTLSGNLVAVTNETTIFQNIRDAFFQRHPQMAHWPSNHNWKMLQLQIDEVWLIDYFGGATILTPQEYYAADVSSFLYSDSVA